MLLAARRRPWTVALLIGVAVALGLAAVWFAAAVIDAHGPQVGHGCMLVGLALLVLGLPAWGLVGIARQYDTAISATRLAECGRSVLRRLFDPFWDAPGKPVHALAGLAGVLFGYWAACWLVCLALACVVHLGITPPGQFR